MPAFDRSRYSRKQTLDVYSALARAIANKLRNLDVRGFDGMPMPFGAVYETWPDSEDSYIAPCTAVILPVPQTYAASQLTPSLLECTWEPRGMPGLGLYKLSEVEVDFNITIRCPSAEERRVFLAAIEQCWVSDGVLMDGINGIRYGVVIEMPEYWGIIGEFALKSVNVQDDQDSAMREHREATIVVSALAPQVKLGPVQPMKLTIRQEVYNSDEDFNC